MALKLMTYLQIALLILGLIIPSLIQTVSAQTVVVVQTVVDDGTHTSLINAPSSEATSYSSSSDDNFVPQYDDQMTLDDSGNVIVRPWINISHVDTTCSYLLPLSDKESDAQCQIIDTGNLDWSKYVCEYASDGIMECTPLDDLSDDCPKAIAKSSMNKSTHLKSASETVQHIGYEHYITFLVAFTTLSFSIFIV